MLGIPLLIFLGCIVVMLVSKWADDTLNNYDRLRELKRISHE